MKYRPHVSFFTILVALLCVAEGVLADDIIISTTTDFDAIASAVNGGTTYSGITIKLANDLDYTDKTFTPIGGATGTTRIFAGTFDGQGHTISGISLRGDSRKGVFNLVTGTVRNLTVSDCTFSSTTSSVGGIVAMLTGGGTIENCHTTASVTIEKGIGTGGIVGRCENGNVIACTSAANVGTEIVNNANASGGIVGSAGGSPISPATYEVNVRHCLYYGTFINVVGMYGAIVGLNETATGLTIALENNFYITSQAGVFGVGYEKKGGIVGTIQNFDETDDYGAVRTHIVTSSDDISDMGDAGVPYSYDGCTPYDYGVKYGSTYYSHVLALEDNADNSALLSAYNGQIFDVKLRGRRLYKDGNWNTICLPFYVANNSIFSSNDGCTVMELDIINTYNIKGDVTGYAYKTGCEEDKLYLFFHRVYALNAGQPYIVKWTRVDGYNENDPSYDHLSPVFSNVTIHNTLAPTTSKDEKVTFQPVYDVFQRDYKDLTVLFLGAANTLYYPSGAGAAKVKPCRAYFQLNGVQMADNSIDMDDDEEFIPSGGGDAKALVLDIEGDATGVEAMKDRQMQEKSKCDRCYTLDGRRIDGNRFPSKGSELKSGIYIVNGKKLLVK